MLSPRSRRRSPSPAPASVRASSRDRGVDPVLAKYHAIKRELEASASRRGTPTRTARHQDTTASRATPRALMLTSPGPVTPKQMHSSVPSSTPLVTASRTSGASEVAARTKVDELEAEVSSLRQTLRSLRAENMHLKRREGDARTEDSDRLQGRAAALEESLRETSRQLEAAEARSRAVEADLASEKARRHDAEDHAADLQHRCTTLESERDRFAESAKANNAASVAHSGAEDTLRRQIKRLESDIAAVEDQRRDADLAHRDALRQKQNELQERDLRIVALEERASEVENRRLRAVSDEEARGQQVVKAEKAVASLSIKYDNAVAENAQLRILRDEAEADKARAADLVADLRAEMQRQLADLQERDTTIDNLRREVAVRDSLETQLAAQQASLRRVEEELHASRMDHEATQRKCKEAEERASQLGLMLSKLSEAEALASGRQLTIDELRKEAAEAKRVHESLRTALEDSRTEVREADAKTEHERCRVHELQDEIGRLEEDVAVLNEVHGKLASLNDALEQRSSQVNKLNIEVHAWQSKCTSLEGDVEILQRFRAAASDLEAENDRLQATIATLEEKTELLGRQAEEQQEVLRMKEADLVRRKEAVQDLEHELASLMAQAADRDQLDSRLRQAQAANQERVEELRRERDRCSQLQQELRSTDTSLAEERSRRAETEAKLHELTQRLSDSQVEAGKLSVSAEASERDRQRLERELTHKSEVCDRRGNELSRLEATLRDAETALAHRQQQIAELTASLEATRAKLQETQEYNASLKSQLEGQQSDSHDLAEEVHRVRRELAARTHEAAAASRLSDRCEGLERDLKDATIALQDSRQDAHSLREEVEALEKFHARCAELEQQLAKSRDVVASFQDDATTASRRLVEKERELGRLRERVTSLTGDLQTSETRLRSSSQRLEECEAEREKLQAVEGQLAGLTIVAQQRTRDLDAAREQVNDLRARLRDTERASLQRSSEATQALVRDLEAKVASRDQLVARLETEIQQRDHSIDSLREDVARGASALSRCETETNRLRAETLALESARAKALAEVNALSSLKAGDGAAARGHAADELAQLRHENSRLRADLHATQALSTRREASAPRRSGSVGGALEGELRRTQVALEALSEERVAQDELVRKQAAELAVASENISTLQTRLHHATPQPTWRERRDELAQLDAERAREYSIAARSADRNDERSVDTSMQL